MNILYQDEQYVAIHKPTGLFAHPSEMNPKETSAMIELRNQLGRWVYPVHRLDRATSGIMLFAVNSEAAREASFLFTNHQVEKTYHAVVRGFLDGEGFIDHPLKKEGHGDLQEAQTSYRLMAQVELPIPNKRFPNSRYTLVEAKPKTGRMHQIRRHFVHLRHPIVGDTTYGDGTHNKIFREHFQLNRLLLFAIQMKFIHPYTEECIVIDGKADVDLKRVESIFEV